MHRPTTAFSARLLSSPLPLAGRQSRALGPLSLRRPANCGRTLSHHAALFQSHSQHDKPPAKAQTTPKQAANAGPSGNPEYPKISFETLGITGPMKWLIVAILSVFGTIETWVWCKTIWRWWKGGKEEEGAMDTTNGKA